ncbi:uracil-DNA glycosylase family protein [Pseudooceanicola sp.]|uniref:uracil-DNA glycosylase family protein n=1 Tax=Pseudooceanicola sp. TaxID=1914328 RepID=UPI0026204292|nr:uracil-DNA glycosylase family protein [Pseudooceanicola sp.]MDF1855687.1 uracil-DNA glycosylase family protein [Pseudooceanicola sp.]
MPQVDRPSDNLSARIRQCRICADRFASTATAHAPRPVVWFRPGARLLIAGQAPGLRVHESGRPFDDRSGDRLRDWMGLDRDTFYDLSRIAVVPMAFCFPGYDGKGADLPPPPICARSWHSAVMAGFNDLRLRLLVGGHAQSWHLGRRAPVSAVLRDWRRHLPGTIPLPHPSWRNTGWLKKNPWFETELVPVLRRRVQEALQ